MNVKSKTRPLPYHNLLIIFLILHLITWTLSPILMRYNLPLDSIEGATWAQNLTWGYAKNPYLSAWLTAFAIYLNDSSGWTIYLFSQIAIIIAMYGVWLLAKEILPKQYALISVLLLESVQYFNIHAIDFSDNTIELMFFVWISYFFYRAIRSPSRGIKQQEFIYWLFTGITLGLGVMTKYYTLILLAPITLILMTNPHARKQLKTLPPYLALFIFILIITPHMIWLNQHHYITINYMLSRTINHGEISNHFHYAMQFFYDQALVFLPAILLFASLFIFSTPLSLHEKYRINQFDKQYLILMGLSPFLITLLLSIITGIKLRAGWGTPLISLWGILLFLLIQPRLTFMRIKLFFMMMIALMMIMVFTYYYIISHKTYSSANFPGSEIANKIDALWRKNSNEKLLYVVGSRWLAGNVHFYSSYKPKVILDNADLYFAKLKKHGGVMVWDMTKQKTMPEKIQRNFTNVKILNFEWHRSYVNSDKMIIGIVIYPVRYAQPSSRPAMHVL